MVTDSPASRRALLRAGGALWACSTPLASVAATTANSHAAPVDLFPRAAASYLVVVNGQRRWARAPDTRRPVASLAKLLAALVWLDGESDSDHVVTVSPRAARVEGVRLGLRPGERVRAGDLLGATLVASSNDACLALAEHHAGSVATFVERMNLRAAALGLHDSRFEHPCGLDRPGQFSTANDLWRLAQAALATPALAKWVAQPRGELRTQQGRRLRYRSSNLLLGRFDGATGLKTGTTSRAGPCLIAAAQRRGHTALVVLLDAADRWTTAAILLEEALRVADSR